MQSQSATVNEFDLFTLQIDDVCLERSLTKVNILQEENFATVVGGKVKRAGFHITSQRN